MRKLNKEEFYQKLNEQTVLQNFEISEDLVWRGEGHEKTFSNCKFKTWFLQPRVASITFNNCSFDTLQIEIIQSLDKVTINNCSINSLYILGKEVHSINQLELIGGDKTIENIQFEGNFGSSKITLNGLKKLKKATLKVNCFAIDFEALQNIDFLVVSGEVRKEMNIKNCQNLDYFSIRDLKGQRLECSDSSELNMHFEGLEAKYINFNRCTTVSLDTTYITADHIGFNEGSFDKIQLFHQCHFNLKTTSYKVPLQINSLIFAASQIPKGRVLDFEEVAFGEVSFDKVRNEGSIHLLNSDISERLVLYNSNPGQLQFTNVTIQHKCRIDLLDSNLTDVLFNSFRWNQNHRLFEKFDPWIMARHNTHLSYLLSLRESYRQLKANYLKSGNKIEALEFQKGEMNVHYRILSAVKFKSLTSFGNYLIVATNKWFSDFGQNIWKPVVWLFVAHLVIFNLIILSFELGIGVADSFDSIDRSATLKGINLFFHTLLPTHFATVKNLQDSEVSIAGFLDFLDRLLTGYFIFYFISASRKYHQ